MALEPSALFLQYLENTDCMQLLTFVKVYWAEGTIVYSEQEVLFNPEVSLYSFPALLAVGSFNTSLKLNNNGTTNDFNVTIDDSDGHLRRILNQEILNGVRVDLMINFSNLTESEALTIGVGTINSDNIFWSDDLRSVNFGVENVLFSKSVSFKPYPEMVPRQDLSFVQNYVPFVFGSPRRVPAATVFAGGKALVTHVRKFTGISEALPPDVVPPRTEAYILDTFVGYELDESIDVVFFELSRLAFEPEALNPITGTPLKMADGSILFVPDHVVDEFADVNLLPFNMSDPDLVYPSGANFTSFNYWWVDLDPATTDMAARGDYLNFEDLHGRPSRIACKVVEHIEYPVASGKFRIKLSHQPRWGSVNKKRDSTDEKGYKKWWFNLRVNLTTGEFGDSVKIQSRATQVRFNWNVNFIEYIQVDRAGNVKNDEVDNIFEDVIQTTGAARPSLSVIVSDDSDDDAFKYFTSLWVPEQKDTSLATFLTYDWRLVNKSGFADKVETLIITGTTSDINEAIMAPDNRNISKFITNIFKSGVASQEPDDITVFAESNFASGLIPVSSTSITVSHSALIDGETLEQTVLDISPSLSYARFNGFYTGNIFVDHTTAFEAHDGNGGVVTLDTSNALDVIAWLIDVYTLLDVQDQSSEWLTLYDSIKETKMAFYINTETDAIELANRIAWEHKIALRFFNNAVTVINLNVVPKIEHHFTVSNVQLKSIKTGFIPSTDVVTDFRFRFLSTKEDGEGEEILFSNNISKYGRNTQVINILTLDNVDDVFELVKFWGNRLSNAWRTVQLKASVEALKLQPYDAVTFDIPVISRNLMTGFVEEVKYEPNSMDVTVTCVLASIASDTLSNGEPSVDTSYWEGLKDLKLSSDKRTGLVSELDGAELKRFSLSDLNSLKPFERRL